MAGTVDSPRPTPPTVRVQNVEIPKPIAQALVVSLTTLRAEEPLAYEALIQKCRTPESEISGPHRRALHARALLTSPSRDGALASCVREVGLAFAEKFGDKGPVAQVNPIPGYPTGDLASFDEDGAS